MLWLTLGFIVIVLVIFLVYKQRGNTVVDVQKKTQIEAIPQNSEESLPQIDIKEIASIIPNLGEEDSTTDERREGETSNKIHTVIPSNIEWTEELREVRRIMLLAPRRRKSNLDNDAPAEPKRYEKYETLSIEEQYELAKQFARLIEEADGLRNQGKLTEESFFCINAIKWCAKNGLSVIYWQSRLNQVNKLVGKPSIKIDSVSTPKPKTTKNEPIQSTKRPVKKNPLLGFSVSDFDNNISRLIQQEEFEQARVLCQKLIDYSNATKQKYYEEKARRVLRIISGRKKKKTSFLDKISPQEN